MAEHLNAYVVVSEFWEDRRGCYDDPPDPPEWGALWAIVLARSPGQARYLTLETDHAAWGGNFRDSPKMSVRLLGPFGMGVPGTVESGEWDEDGFSDDPLYPWLIEAVCLLQPPLEHPK